MVMAEIKNIVFDMGNVLITFDPDRILNRHQLTGDDRKAVEKELFGGGEWHELDRGTITEAELIAAVAKRLPEHLKPVVAEIMSDWYLDLPALEESYDLVRELKMAGYRIYLLSNASLRFYDYEKKIAAFEYFDGKLVSADYLMAKPEPEIYQKLFEVFQLNPEECFFIDDLAPNIAAAKVCGMNGYQYDGNMEKLRQALNDYGVAVSTEKTLQFVPVMDEIQVKELAQLAFEIWNQHFVPIIGQGQVDYMLERFQSDAAMTQQISEGYCYFFFHYNGRNVGYIGIKAEDGALFLSKLYLKKAYRGRKLAKQAIAFLEQLAQKEGLSKIWLTVNKYNYDTIAVYQKSGFCIVREQVADIGNGFVMDDYIMEKPIAKQ